MIDLMETAQYIALTISAVFMVLTIIGVIVFGRYQGKLMNMVAAIAGISAIALVIFVGLSTIKLTMF
jgi:hypothetical protein